MPSVATRDSLRSYELENNSLLRAVQPGGILHFAAEHGPLQALLLPREIALLTCGVSPFLQISSSLTAPTSPVSSKVGASTSGSGQQQTQWPRAAPESAPLRLGRTHPDLQDENLEMALRTLSVEQHRCVTHILRRFLQYHLIFFESSSTLQFSTCAGDRGLFDDSLETISLLNSRHSKPITVLAEADPLRPAYDRSVAEFHPLHLQIFLIDKVFVTPPQMQELTHALQSVLLLDSPVVHVLPSGRFEVLDAATAGAQQAPPLGPVPSAVAIGGGSKKSGKHATNSSSQKQKSAPEGSSKPNPDDDDGDSSSCMSDDVVVEYDDLTPYSTKAKEREAEARERQQEQHRKGALNSANAVTTGGSNNSKGEGSAAAANGKAQGPKIRGSGRNSHSASATSSPSASPAQGGLDTAAAAAAAASASPANNRPLSDLPAAEPHGGVRRHEYTKSSIIDYRRAVAPDNYIFYEEFESLMATPFCEPIVRLVTSFMSSPHVRDRNYIFRDNREYSAVVSACLEEMQRTPEIVNNSHVSTVLAEGIERYITSKLYFRIFNTVAEDSRRNKLLQDKLLRVRKLTAKDLDALEGVESHHVWGQAMFELDGMNFFKSPREKLRCSMRACEMLSLAVSDELHARKASRGGASSPAGGAAKAKAAAPTFAFGADEFIPCFILLVLRARPSNFCQNVSYIDRYRTPMLCTPEESYCLANMMSAIEFWLNCDDHGQMQPEPEPESTSRLPRPAVATSAARSAASAPSSGSIAAAASDNTSKSRRVAKPIPPPPNVMADTCLPSVKSSLTPSATNVSANERPGAPTADDSKQVSDQKPQDEGAGPMANLLPKTNVLDALFGWSGRAALAAYSAAGSQNQTTHIDPSGPVPIKGVLVSDGDWSAAEANYGAVNGDGKATAGRSASVPVATATGSVVHVKGISPRWDPTPSPPPPPTEGLANPFAFLSNLRNTLTGGGSESTAATTAAASKAVSPAAVSPAAGPSSVPDALDGFFLNPPPGAQEAEALSSRMQLAQRIPHSYDILCLRRKTYGTLTDAELRSIIEELQGAFSS